MSSNRLRILLVSMLAVFAISAIASASASAKGWWVCKQVAAGTGTFNSSLCNVEGGTREWEILAVPAGEKWEFSGFEHTTVSRIIFQEKAITIECPEISFINKKGEETHESGGQVASDAFLTGTNSGEIFKIQFSDCKVTTKPEAPKCKIGLTKEEEEKKETGDITTGEITVELSATTGKVTLKPKGSTTFASFKLAECGILNGEYKVKGETEFTISEPESCKENHTITIKEAPSKLTVAGKAVEVFEIVTELEGVESDICWDVK
jgi:hypothetical protein